MIDTDPTYAALVEKAAGHDARGDLDTALDLYDEAISLAPTDPFAWRGKAAALAGALRYDESLDVLRAAVRAAPTDEALLGLLITNLREVGLKDEAFEVGQRAIGAAPSSPWVIKAVADTWRDRGAYVKALTLYDRGLDLDPDNTMMLNGKATALFMQEDHAGAAWIYRRIISLRPDDGLAWLNLGLAEEHQGHKREALEAYDRTLALRPSDADALGGRQRCASAGRDYSFRTGVIGGPVVCHVTPDGAELRRQNGRGPLRKVDFSQVTGGRWIEWRSYYYGNAYRTLALETPHGVFRLVQRDGMHGGTKVPDLTPYYAACEAVLRALAVKRPGVAIRQGYGRWTRWMMAVVFVPAILMSLLIALSAIFEGGEGSLAGTIFLVLCALGLGGICVYSLIAWNPLKPTPSHTPLALADDMAWWIRNLD